MNNIIHNHCKRLKPTGNSQIQQSFLNQTQTISVLSSEDKIRNNMGRFSGADMSSEWFRTSFISRGDEFADPIIPDSESEAPLGSTSNDDHTFYSLERIDDEQSEATTSTTDYDEEEQVRKPNRKRTYSEIHNLSERKRRDKINKKMRALQALIPNSDKVDKATMLENAIDYLKSLQLQLQLMTIMGSRVCMMAGMGMGMRMPIGVGFFPTPFPNAPRMMLIPAPFIPLTTTSLPIPPNSGSPASILDFISMNNSQFQESIQVRRQSIPSTKPQWFKH